MSALRCLAPFCTALVLCLFSHAAFAAPRVELAWDANPAAEQVVGYRLHWSTVSRTAPAFTGFDQELDVGNVTTWSLDLPADTSRYYFSVTAYNSDGLSSDYSTELGTVVVTPSATTGGTVVPNEPTVVKLGSSLEVRFTPDADCRLEDIELDGAAIAAETLYTLADLDAPHTVRGRFAPVTTPPTSYSVSLTAGAHGSILPSGQVPVDAGGDLGFTVTPDSGYQAAAVTVDGIDVGPVQSYTLADVNADTVINASFELVPAATDGDADQLPDSWELQYFSGLGQTATGDLDNDGRTNYQEYLAGTDPTVADLEESFTPAVSAPIDGATVVTTVPELAVDNPVHDPEPEIVLSYQFAISTNSDMSQPLATAEDVVESNSGVTAWPLPLALADLTRYYWRARCASATAVSAWSSINTFYLDTRGAATTTALVAASYITHTDASSVEVDTPSSAVFGLGVETAPSTLPYDFILTVSTVDNPPPAPRSARLAGKTVEFGPHGRPFTEDVTLLVPYTDQTLAEAGIQSASELNLLTFNTASLGWEVVPDVVRDYAGHRLVARVSHFSMYSLGAATDQTPVAAPANASGGGGGGGCFLRSLW